MKPILRMFVVYPKAGGVGPQTAPVLPLMLSTKLLPEMEAERVSFHLSTHRSHLRCQTGLNFRTGKPNSIPRLHKLSLPKLRREVWNSVFKVGVLESG